MNRRNFASAVVLLTGVTAGCTAPNQGTDANGDDRSPTDTPTKSASETPAESPTESPTETRTESPTETPTESPTESPSDSGAVTETSFEILENECGTGQDEATVDQGTDQVVVEGTISGRNSCFTAELEAATYDTDTGELTVAVRSYSSDGGNGGCTECLVDIEYRATVSYDAPDPESVTVLHNDEPVA